MICNKCSVDKPDSDFYKDISKRTGLMSYCKVCVCARGKAHSKSPKGISIKKAYRELPGHRSRARNYASSYSKLPSGKARIRAYERSRYATDPCYRLMDCLRRRLRYALHENAKMGSAVRDLGCTVPELKRYLEKRFATGMTWDNHGTHGWHIDHIKPLASFDLADPDQCKQAIHHTNLQPLWAEDNLRKGARVA